MTHASVAGTEAEVEDTLLRLSVGIENETDLIADLEQALEVVVPATAVRLCSGVGEPPSTPFRTRRLIRHSAPGIRARPTAAGWGIERRAVAGNDDGARREYLGPGL